MESGLIDTDESRPYSLKKEVTKRYCPDTGLEQVMDEWIAKSVLHFEGNVRAAADALGISRNRLYRHLGTRTEAK